MLPLETILGSVICEMKYARYIMLVLKDNSRLRDFWNEIC